MVWSVWLVYCVVLGVVVVVVMGLISGCGLPLVANLLLLMLEELFGAGPPGRVGCFGLTEGAGPAAVATVGG